MSNAPQLPPRRRPPAFRPSFTLSALYMAGFFFLFAMLFVMPELLRVLREVPPGPEQQAIAQEAAAAAARPRLIYAVLAALATVGLGAWLQILPGLRPR